MKKIIIALIAVISLGVIGTVGIIAKNHTTADEDKFFNSAKKYKRDKTVVAVVDNEKIYKYQVDFMQSSQRLSKENAEKNGYDASEITVDSADKILKSIIRETVALNEAKRLKLTAKYSDAKKYITENYNAMMSEDSENSRFMKQYLNEMNFSEKEYLKQASEAYQDTLTRTNLYNYFIKDREGTEEELKLQYEQYLDELTDKADIVYTNAELK